MDLEDLVIPAEFHLVLADVFGIRVRATAVMSSAGADSSPEVVPSVPMIDGELS